MCLNNALNFPSDIFWYLKLKSKLLFPPILLNTSVIKSLYQTKLDHFLFHFLNTLAQATTATIVD